MRRAMSFSAVQISMPGTSWARAAVALAAPETISSIAVIAYRIKDPFHALLQSEAETARRCQRATARRSARPGELPAGAIHETYAAMESFVYVIGCADERRYLTYVGWTLDVARRLAQHNAGTGARSTRGRQWVLLHVERFATR